MRCQRQRSQEEQGIVKMHGEKNRVRAQAESFKLSEVSLHGDVGKVYLADMVKMVRVFKPALLDFS
jgi:hypothetical protein